MTETTNEFKGKVIYKPKGRAGEYSVWAANFYTSCSNGCKYCYLKQGLLSKNCGGNKAGLKKCFKDENDAARAFESEFRKNYSELHKHGLFFSFTTDACLPNTIGLTIQAVDLCQRYDVPVKILTKSDILTNDKFESLLSMPKRDLIAIGYTLTGHDELEPNAFPNKDRIAQMKRFKKLGFMTFASIEPIVTFSSAKKVIEASKNFCDLYLIGINDRWRKKYKIDEAKKFVEWLMNFNKPKIYLKQTLLEMSTYNFMQLRDNFVSYDYRMFPMYEGNKLEDILQSSNTIIKRISIQDSWNRINDKY